MWKRDDSGRLCSTKVIGKVTKYKYCFSNGDGYNPVRIFGSETLRNLHAQHWFIPDPNIEDNYHTDSLQPIATLTVSEILIHLHGKTTVQFLTSGNTAATWIYKIMKYLAHRQDENVAIYRLSNLEVLFKFEHGTRVVLACFE